VADAKNTGAEDEVTEEVAATPEAEAAADAPATEVPAGAEETAADETPADDAPAGDAPEAEAAAAKPKARRTRRKAADAEPADDESKAEPAREPGERPVVRAQAKYVRTSARKARLVCDHIRGKSVTEARAILAHTPRAVATDWEKLLESAVANAEHNHELIGDELRIATVTADEGPTLKRFQPRAKGRASRIRKRTSHLTITLTPGE
jgi:ribosomal protein L22